MTEAEVAGDRVAGLMGPGHVARLVAAETAIGSQGTRLTAAEGTIGNQGTRLSSAEGTLANHGPRLTAVEGVAGAALPKAGGTMTGVALGTVVPVAYGASITLNLTTGQMFNVADLTGPVTFTVSGAIPVGYRGAVYTRQDATGNRSISFDSMFVAVGNAVANMAAGKRNLIYLEVYRAGEVLYSIGAQD